MSFNGSLFRNLHKYRSIFGILEGSISCHVEMLRLHCLHWHVSRSCEVRKHMAVCSLICTVTNDHKYSFDLISAGVFVFSKYFIRFLRFKSTLTCPTTLFYSEKERQNKEEQTKRTKVRPELRLSGKNIG